MNREEIDYQNIVENTILPTWLTDELPVKKRLNTMSWSNDHNAFYILEDENPEYYSNGYNLYSLIQKNSAVDFAINKNINGKNGIKLISDSLASCNGYMLISSTDTDKENILKHSYDRWINEIYKNYINEPNNWVYSYEYINYHPIFWIHSSPQKTFNWITDDGTDNIYSMVGMNKGVPYVALECGEHTETYNEHYHNTDLDIYADNFENAYVKLAVKIEQYFTAEGNYKNS